MYELYVGQGKQYAKIIDAVNEWRNPNTINKQQATIYVSKGLYKERIYLEGQSNLSFIGEDKNLVTWKNGSGYYMNAPLTIGGNVLIKGITFVADTSDNPDYVYTSFDGSYTSGAAYALHIDDGTSTGEVVVEDCDVISYVNAGIGSGTRINQQIRLENCRVYSYTNISAVKGYGALLYHTSSTAGHTGQKFTAKNSHFYSQYDKAANIPSWGDNTPVPLEFAYCTFESGAGITGDNLVMFSYGAGATQIKTYMTDLSYANNVSKLNKVVVPSFSLTPQNLTIDPNKTQQFTATDTNSVVIKNRINWSTSDVAIATINQSGLLTALKAGTVTVTADVNGVLGTCEVIIRNYNITQSGIFQSSEIGTYTITCTDPVTSVTSTTTVTVVATTVNLITETQSTSLSSFGTYNFETNGNKYGFVQLNVGGYQATDLITLECSTDQVIWDSISVTSFINNGYCKINTTNNYYFRFKVVQGTITSYSETLDTTTFYKTPVLTGTKWYFINKNLHIRTQIEDNSVEDSIKFEYSTDQNGQWTELNSTYLGWNIHQTDFDESGKTGTYYTRSKIVRPANTFYSNVDSIDLNSLGAKNVVGYNPLLPKTPTSYLDARIGFPVGAVKLGKTHTEPKSIAKLGSFPLSRYTLGTYVSIDIKLNTTLTTQRYYSNKADTNLVYELLQYYSNLSVVDIQYSLVRAEKIIKLINIINPEIELEVKQLQNIRIKSKTNPQISIESILNGEVELTSDLDFEIEIESKV